AKVYVTVCAVFTHNGEFFSGVVFVIGTDTNTVITTIDVDGFCPRGVAVSPDGSTVYVGASVLDVNVGAVLVIATATDTVIARLIGPIASGLAVTPDGSKVYVATAQSFFGPPSVVVVDTATNGLIATIPVGGNPLGVAVTPDSSEVYVTNITDNNVSVIDT